MPRTEQQSAHRLRDLFALQDFDQVRRLTPGRTAVEPHCQLHHLPARVRELTFPPARQLVQRSVRRQDHVPGWIGVDQRDQVQFDQPGKSSGTVCELGGEDWAAGDEFLVQVLLLAIQTERLEH